MRAVGKSHALRHQDGTVAGLVSQLRSPFQVSALSDCLMRAAPHGPRDDERGLDAALAEVARDEADLLEGSANERRVPRVTRGGICSSAAFAR